MNGTTTRAINDFKNIMEDVFHYKNEDDMLPSLGSINVKGPLKVQEYYELSGKYTKSSINFNFLYILKDFNSFITIITIIIIYFS